MSDYDEPCTHQIADIIYRCDGAEANQVWLIMVASKEFQEYTALNNALDCVKLDNLKEIGALRDLYRESARLRAACARKVLEIVHSRELQG